MPLCTLYLIALDHATPHPHQSFLSTLKSTNLSPLLISRVIRWIILPSTFSTEHLLARNIHWDFLLVLPATDTIPPPLQQRIQHTWSITAGVPSRLTQNFAQKNAKLLSPDAAASVPAVNPSILDTNNTTPSSQNLELSSDLRDWIRGFSSTGTPAAKGAVSMLNLLSFHPGMKASYLEYGKAFASSIGSSHGGNAKIVGGVTALNGAARAKDASDGEGWDEVAVAQYPSVLHFADMLGDEAYQVVNHRYRVPALRDTCILMTSEIAVGEVGGGGAKL